MSKQKITGALRPSVEEKIKGTALDLFSRNGYFSTNVSQLAKEAGVSTGLVYHYFECKTAILEATLKDRVSSNIRLFGLFDVPIQRLDADGILQQTFSVFKNNEAYWKLAFQVLLQKNKFPNAYKIIYDSYDKPYLELLTNYFSYQKYGNPQTNSQLYFSYINGMLFNYLFRAYPIDINASNEYFAHKAGK